MAVESVIVEEERTLDQRGELNEVARSRRRARRLQFGAKRRDRMLHLASLLPASPRALMTAFLHAELSVRELAVLHGTTPRKMRRRLDRLCRMVEDPEFQVAAVHAPSLPGQLGQIARAHWLEGRTLRELAEIRGESLHRIRQFVVMARIILAELRRPRG